MNWYSFEIDTRLFRIRNIQIAYSDSMPGTKSRRPKRVRSLSLSSLSRREHQILELLAEGLSNKEIGDSLRLSPFTVKNHLARIFPKLRVRSRTAAVSAYLRA